MGRIYGVPITVCEQDGRPVRFTWEGRLFVVRRVIDHWVSLRSDWTPAVQPRQPERAYWRVKAGVQRAPGVYELQHDARAGEWLLARVWD
ncbi:DUF6504 family protein [Allosalinactinospora lopnorensis]|uniref:DUF6504 family protein n=1 Tax=Allosalinactinospora lopnorensis TaxID=1352348 RepID=UPI000623E248|nr:DUF6504 family protein [Allosalinactinospora lopnorensis]